MVSLGLGSYITFTSKVFFPRKAHSRDGGPGGGFGIHEAYGGNEYGRRGYIKLSRVVSYMVEMCTTEHHAFLHEKTPDTLHPLTAYGSILIFGNHLDCLLNIFLHTSSSSSSSSSCYFSFSRQESPQRVSHLHLFLTSASSSVTSTTVMSLLTAYIYLIFLGLLFNLVLTQLRMEVAHLCLGLRMHAMGSHIMVWR